MRPTKVPIQTRTPRLLLGLGCQEQRKRPVRKSSLGYVHYNSCTTGNFGRTKPSSSMISVMPAQRPHRSP